MLDRKTLAPEALLYASMAHCERTKHPMIALRASPGSFPARKRSRTEALTECSLGRKSPVSLGTKRLRVMTRYASAECGKALAGGP